MGHLSILLPLKAYHMALYFPAIKCLDAKKENIVFAFLLFSGFQLWVNKHVLSLAVVIIKQSRHYRKQSAICNIFLKGNGLEKFYVCACK